MDRFLFAKPNYQNIWKWLKRQNKQKLPKTNKNYQKPLKPDKHQPRTNKYQQKQTKTNKNYQQPTKTNKRLKKNQQTPTKTKKNTKGHQKPTRTNKN